MATLTLTKSRAKDDFMFNSKAVPYYPLSFAMGKSGPFEMESACSVLTENK